MNKNGIIALFENLGFRTITHAKLGKLVLMSGEDAYLLSATTGAKYMFYENGVTMKGRSEVFIHRSVFSDGHLIYSPGLFSRDLSGNIREGNSAFVLKRRYPCVFEAQKYVLVYDVPEKVPSNIESTIYHEIIASGDDPQKYVVYKNYLSNNVGESFQEYLASMFFIRQGYLVENQVPWFQQNYKYNGQTLQGGIPDFSAFHSTISNNLTDYGIITNTCGIAVQLLPVLVNFRENAFVSKTCGTSSIKRRLVIGEAKTSKNSLDQAIKQLDKYAKVNIADEFFTIIPDSYGNPQYGSMYITADHRVKYDRKILGITTDGRTLEDSKWMDTYIKALLLGNISFENVICFINEYRKTAGLKVYKDYECVHLLDAVQNTPNDTFMNYIAQHA